MVFYLNKDTVNQDEKEKNSENVFLFLNKKGEIELIGHRLRVIVLSRCSYAVIKPTPNLVLVFVVLSSSFSPFFTIARVRFE